MIDAKALAKRNEQIAYCAAQGLLEFDAQFKKLSEYDREYVYKELGKQFLSPG